MVFNPDNPKEHEEFLEKQQEKKIPREITCPRCGTKFDTSGFIEAIKWRIDEELDEVIKKL